MAALSTLIAVGGLAVAGASAYSANKNQKKAIAQQNEALQYQQKQNNLAAARQKRDAIRQARIARAQATNAGASQDVLNASSTQGGVGSIGSQLSGELSFLDQWNQWSDQASKALGRANVYAQRAQTAGEISKLGMGAFNNADYLSNSAKKIFSNGG